MYRRKSINDSASPDRPLDFGTPRPGITPANIAMLRSRRASDHVGIFQQLVDGQPEQAGLIDFEDWTILAVNAAWQRTVTLNGFSNFAPGANYYEELNKIAGDGYGPAQAALGAIEEIRQHKRTSFRMVYDGGGLQAGRKFETRIGVIKVGGRSYIRIIRYDITELMELRTLRNDFSNTLMKVQETERRRMGRELHDSGMQLLAAMSLSLGRLKQVQATEEGTAIIAEMEDLLFEGQKEFRAMSYLAHPPQVERLGLAGALQLLAEGFGQRAGLETSFGTEGPEHEASPDADHTLYRVAQEALSNVHRHAHANRLTVRLIVRPRALHVAIADNGRGMHGDIRRGVGLLSMESRMRELGGRLSIRNTAPGTVVLASLPLPLER